MTKLLQKAFDEAARLPEREQNALASLRLEEIHAERQREAPRAGMSWHEIRERHPHQWLLLEALEAHSTGGQRILERLVVLDVCPDGLTAMKEYGRLHRQEPHRDLYFLHTDRESLEIEEVPWAGIRASS